LIFRTARSRCHRPDIAHLSQTISSCTDYSILVLGNGPDIRDECDAPLPPTGPAPLSIGCAPLLTEPVVEGEVLMLVGPLLVVVLLVVVLL
jgi:hypothetical protein